MYTVGRLAKRFSLSRSTLLYYDSIGLLSPSGRSMSNYRLYSEADVRRMERITLYRDAGLPLEVIARLLRDEENSAASVLERHLQRLNDEIGKLREQQRIITHLLGNARPMPCARSMTKEQWVALLTSSGMDEEGMQRWHTEFERNFPEAHQDFLESLGIPQEEIVLIRRFSAGLSVESVSPTAEP